MKTFVRINAVFSAIAAFALLGLSTGCATTSKIGDGKLEPGTKLAVGAAATAAKIAAPDYAGAIDAAKDKLVTMGEAPSATADAMLVTMGEAPSATADAMLTDAQFFAAAKRLGFGVSLVYRYKGAVVDGADVSWTWSADRSHTGADAVPPSAEEVSAAVSGESAEAESDIDARLDAAFERLAEKKKAK